MLSMLYVRLTIKVKEGIPESFKVGWYTHKVTGSSHLKRLVVSPIYISVFRRHFGVCKSQLENVIEY